jgi:hypothetical protein
VSSSEALPLYPLGLHFLSFSKVETLIELERPMLLFRRKGLSQAAFSDSCIVSKLTPLSRKRWMNKPTSLPVQSFWGNYSKL